VKERPLGSIDDLIAEIAGIPIEELVTEPTEDGRHLISVDELRAAGALDVPAAWRKSLANESSYTLPGFGDDDTDEGADSPAVAHDDEDPADDLS
jgi:hypothetical protein